MWHFFCGLSLVMVMSRDHCRRYRGVFDGSKRGDHPHFFLCWCKVSVQVTLHKHTNKLITQFQHCIINRMAATCQLMYAIAGDGALWECLLMREFKYVSTKPLPKYEYKRIYRDYSERRYSMCISSYWWCHLHITHVSTVYNTGFGSDQLTPSSTQAVPKKQKPASTGLMAKVGSLLWGKKKEPMRIVMLGLDAAGKVKLYVCRNKSLVTKITCRLHYCTNCTLARLACQWCVLVSPKHFIYNSTSNRNGQGFVSKQ